jgi:hypothetical protein
MSTEWAFYAFDTIPLFLCVSTYVFFWPPNLLCTRSFFVEGMALRPTVTTRLSSDPFGKISSK